MAKSHQRAASSLKIVQLQETAAFWAEQVLEGTSTGFAIVGPGGLGKTYVIEQLLAKRHISTDHIGKNSHITPLALYQTLYQHRKEPIILLDDIEHIYKQEVSVGLLRSALWGSKAPGKPRKRIVTYTTSKDLLMPDKFSYEGGIIIIGNKIPRQSDPIVEALLSRIPKVEFAVEPADVYAFMRQVMVRRGYAIYDGKKQQDVTIPRAECEKVIDELEARGVTDLRKLEHALIVWRAFKRDRARLKRELDHIARRALVTTLGSQPPKERARMIFLDLVQDQSLREAQKVELFTERTAGLRPGTQAGFSRPTYFRWKQKWERGQL